MAASLLQRHPPGYPQLDQRSSRSAQPFPAHDPVTLRRQAGECPLIEPRSDQFPRRPYCRRPSRMTNRANWAAALHEMVSRAMRRRTALRAASVIIGILSIVCIRLVVTVVGIGGIAVIGVGIAVPIAIAVTVAAIPAVLSQGDQALRLRGRDDRLKTCWNVAGNEHRPEEECAETSFDG